MGSGGAEIDRSITRVLLIEDDREDYVLTGKLLAKIPGREFDLEWVQTYEADLHRVRAAEHDVYLVDNHLGPRKGLELLEETLRQGVTAPIIILTGSGTETVDLEAQRSGAADYLEKGELTAAHLDRAIRYAIEQKRTEAELRLAMNALMHSEQSYRLLAENAADVIWTSGLGLDLNYMSPSIKELTGYTPEEAMALKLQEFYAPESMKVASKAFREETKIEKSSKGYPDRTRKLELQLQCKDGSLVWTETNVSFIRDESGARVGLQGVMRDITERKRAEEELQRLRDELAHVSLAVAMGELATTIAHEINQPLTVILSGAGAARRLLAADEPDLEKLDEVQQLIAESATRAGEVIRHQRDFLHRGEVQQTPVAINELIRNIEHVTRAEALRNKIALLLDLAPDLPSLMGDPIQLEQVILNLIHNGLEAMGDPAWGNRELLLQTSMSGPHKILLRVRDTGPPIDDETFAQMFTPFHSTKPEGLGMGLAISRTITEAHGGHLSSTRNADFGITMDLTLACEEGSSR